MKAIVVEQAKSEKLSVDLKAARKSSFDSEEVQMYLNKLTHLVPNAPKHRKLSKLEVIQCVIDYICDLEDTLMARQVKPNTVLSEKQNTLYPSEAPAAERQS
ncbi:uncharacterized protein LOC119106452 [Pollicipes pollicipes]|uniref:uncharacterized protein LOC119105911 n=1 Tax=Pollicipes pollicipes TaxID=41117 RepID=UPI001884FDC0|nr:uncharacterized protein LOC119105911 [Pollicipes pollicipes]XP_037085994.1 uncharacterized protein LOC119106452 [Pollicipes pollicipes]